MITLTYSLQQSRLTPSEVNRAVTETAIELDLLLGLVQFTVDGIELAWGGYVPLVDMARRMFVGVDRLSSEGSCQYVELLDYYERLTFTLRGKDVHVESEVSRASVSCNREVLLRHVTNFGISVLKDLFRFYRHAGVSESLRTGVPRLLIDRALA